MWRSLELEAIFGGPIDEENLSELVLDRLVQEKVGETEQLDFKGSLCARVCPSPVSRR